MDFSHIISMLFHDKPGVMYENPPPPNDAFEYDFEPIFFMYPRPQNVPDVNFIKVERNLIHKSLLSYEEKEEEQTSTKTLRGKENIKGNENIEGIKAIKTEELSAEVSVNENVSEMVIGRSTISKENFVKSDALDKAKSKHKISQKDEFAGFLEKKKRKERNRSKEKKNNDIDSDYSKNDKKKNVVATKSIALQSISKSYSLSESDSDHSEKRKTKSPSRRSKSHSKKSSRRRRKHKDSRISVKQEIISSDEERFGSFSKKTEITIKKEVLSDKDDFKKKKVKSSKNSKKKYDSKSSDDSKKCTVSRTWEDSRSCDESRHEFDVSQSHDDSRSYDDFTKNRYYSSDDDSRNRRYDDSIGSSNSKSFHPFMKQEIKQESGSASHYAPNDYYCDVCKLILNSETTFSSHMAGKKHKKALRQLSEQEVAKSSIFEITESQNFPKAPGMERINLYEEVSKIQKTCEDAELLIVGLDYVREIRGYEDTKYFCDLCSAQCVANSIIKHLIGFKHQMNCLKVYCYKSHDWVKDLDKRDRRVPVEITLQLKEAKRLHGIGRIKVYRDVIKKPRSPEPYNPYQPSTSKAVLLPKEVQGKKTDEPKVTDEECLSRNFSDFYCKVCDSHMNNYAMWESHARGKKHAKNKKKLKEGSVTNINIEESRDIMSNLEGLIYEECGPNDIIVGLNFIRENQGENGDLFNCFLCGSVCTTIDIIDHLYLKKHKSKYLEKMLADGYNNAINEINCLPIGESAREVLVDDECEKLMIELGRGKPLVVINKKTF